MQQLFPNQEQITQCSDPSGPMVELIQIPLDINILPKLGADWSIIADDRV